MGIHEKEDDDNAAKNSRAPVTSKQVARPINAATKLFNESVGTALRLDERAQTSPFEA